MWSRGLRSKGQGQMSHGSRSNKIIHSKLCAQSCEALCLLRFMTLAGAWAHFNVKLHFFLCISQVCCFW